MDRTPGTETGPLKILEAGAAEAIGCPHCGELLLELTQDCVRVVTGGTWLEDGDAVPGVLDQLPRGREGGHDASLLVGSCLACKDHYWVAEATLLAGDWNQLEAFLGGDAPFDQEAPARFYVGTWRQSRWWMVEQETPAGPVHQHCFGPFGLNSIDTLRGQHGVAACGELAKAPAWAQARDLLLEVWPQLAATHTSRLQGGTRGSGQDATLTH